MAKSRLSTGLLLVSLLAMSNTLAGKAMACEAKCDCRAKVYSISALNAAAQISEGMTLAKLLRDSRNEEAVRFTNAWLRGEVAVGKQLLVLMTTAVNKTEPGPIFDHSQIGKQMARFLHQKKRQQVDVAHSLPKQTQQQLGQYGMQLFFNIYEYERSRMHR